MIIPSKGRYKPIVNIKLNPSNGGYDIRIDFEEDYELWVEFHIPIHADMLIKDEEETYTQCKYCDHFVEYNADSESFYSHLDDGEIDYNHSPKPSDLTMTLNEWKELDPSLFNLYPDGKIGPNSIYHNQRGKE